MVAKRKDRLVVAGRVTLEVAAKAAHLPNNPTVVLGGYYGPDSGNIAYPVISFGSPVSDYYDAVLDVTRRRPLGP
jgi:hypothetical protein